MTIKSELLALKNANDMIIAERAVAWAAKHKQSALHRSLEWDDGAAAHQFRIWQVRRLIAIHIMNDDGIRQVISLSIDRTKPGGGYRSLDDVLPDFDLREILLSDALKELDRIQFKYDQVKELASVWAEKEAVKTRRRRKAA